MNTVMTKREWKTWVRDTWTESVEQADDTALLDCLYEELISLDEQAGCFDEETNARIDEQRRQLAAQIRELEAAE